MEPLAFDDRQAVNEDHQAADEQDSRAVEELVDDEVGPTGRFSRPLEARS